MSNAVSKIKKNGQKVARGVAAAMKRKARVEQFQKEVAEKTDAALAEQFEKRGLKPDEIIAEDFVMHENEDRIDYTYKGELILQALLKEIDGRLQVAFFVPKEKS